MVNTGNEKKYYNQFTKEATTRWSSFGVKDAKICEDVSAEKQNFVSKLISKIFGACSRLNPEQEDRVTGKAYVMTGDNYGVKKASAYALYDTVSSLLKEKKSTAQIIREEYRKEHPIDDSPAGRIAIFTGMTKEEAETALAYAQYLNFIARYDASERYAFGEVFEAPEKGILFEHSEKLNSDLFCFWRKQTEYDDVRNRSFAV